MNCTSCKQAIEAEAVFCGYCGKRTRKRHDSAAGTIVDDTYRIEEKIAEGGFGAIYRAVHLPSGATLALKVLHADFTADPALAARFRRESKALAQLRNRHTVITFERGEARDGTLYIAMELLHGQSLLDRFKARGPMPWREVLKIMRAVCSSLGEAHASGIVHRDLKPANIHLGTDDFVKVLDFGVAKVLPWSAMDDGIDLTLAGQAVGTLEYMAPEQLAGSECDPRTDIYALGVVAYELITGRRPFAEAVNAPMLITALLTQDAPRPSSVNGAVPVIVDQLLLRCLEREAAARFASTQELVAAIDRALGHPSPRSVAAYATAGALQTVGTLATPPIAYALPSPRHAPQLPPFDVAVQGTVIDAEPCRPSMSMQLAARERRWLSWIVAVLVVCVGVIVAVALVKGSI